MSYYLSASRRLTAIRVDFERLLGPIILGLCVASAFATPQAQAQYAQQAKLIGVGSQNSARQGASVALSGDGSTLIVGGPNACLSSGGLCGPGYIGSAWVFRRQGKSWSQEAILNGATWQRFDNWLQGWSVALSQDGNTAIVGAPADGGARIFVRTNGHWSQQATLYMGDRLHYEGLSVAISGDGDTALVGGDGAWLFTRSGAFWGLQRKLTSSDAAGGGWQGWSVALSGDGGAALVGGVSDNGGVGAAWVFQRSNGWTQDGPKLVGAGAVGLAQQGSSVALSRNGAVAIIGGFNDNGGVGASWIFQHRSMGWRQQGQKLVASDAVGASRQGHSVSLSRDGNTALVGGPGDNKGVGAAWSFTRWGDAWLQGPKLVGAQALGAAEQGASVSLSGSGNLAAVGGPSDNHNTGAAWLYYRNFDGQPRVATCYDDSIQALTARFGGLNTAAWSLGYGVANVTPLQSSVHAYCADPGAARAYESQTQLSSHE